jgi:hypothetical protein
VTISTWVLRFRKRRGVVGLLLLAAALGDGCESGLRASETRDAAPGSGTDASQLGGFFGTGGVGSGGNEAGGTTAAPDADLQRDTAAGGSSGTGGRATDGSAAGGAATGGSGGQGGFLDASAGETGRADCAAIAARIASQTAMAGTCTAVVRLDYSTLTILSHAFVCGKYASPDEATARKTASTDATFQYAGPAGDGSLLSGPDPADEWVFFQSPSDFGGVAAVSARSGLTVFAGSIVWMGTGDIIVPSTWDTSDLGSGCAPLPRPSIRGFNLGSSEAGASFDEAADVVLQTALPAAFWQWGYVFDVVVLLYPRSVGAFVPEKAEYIVLVNAGWLE